MARVLDPTSEEPWPAVTAADRRRLLAGVLRGVSRSFYLTLRVLPLDLREPVGLAYLLARAADTVADTRLIPPGDRLDHLLGFRDQVKGPARLEALRQLELALTGKQSRPAEHELLTRLPSAFSMLEGSPEPDRSLVRSVVLALTRGMETDLTTFPAEDSGRIAAFEDDAALDRYTYDVAGCVGEFWTAITMAHVPSLKAWDGERMAQTGVAFGKALQLTNVLRDVPKDLQMGRCYLPLAGLSATGLSPEELLDPSSGVMARPVLVAWIEAALGHYASAEEYLLAIPRRCVRLRLAVLWPVLIGLATLARLARNRQWLDMDHPSRVGRGWVYRTMVFSIPGARSNTLLRGWITHLRKRVEAAL